MNWNKKTREEQRKKVEKEANQERLNHLASYEKNYLSEYNNILKNTPKDKTTYIQPMNKKVPCKIWFTYQANDKWFKEESYKLFWDGECKNGYADGLGREIEKDTLMDRWGLAIYKQGIPTYYVINNILDNQIFEGIDDQKENISYGVNKFITEKDADVDVIIEAIADNKKDSTAMTLLTSPFWNGTYQYIKAYPNFKYVYSNFQKNNTQQMDFEFFLESNNVRNGWAIAKPKNQNITTGEFIVDKFNKN